MAETISSLKKKADKIFSEWKRRSGANWKGDVICFTCFKTFRWQNTDAGHYEPRQFNNTRYDDRNVQVQCKTCNVWKGGQKTIFAVQLQKKYGKGILDDLRNKAKQTKQFTKDELKSIIKKYDRELLKYE